MGQAAAGLLLGALIFLLCFGGLTALQIWLAGRRSILLGMIQPIIWFVLAAVGNIATHTTTPQPSMESGIAGWGAIVMGIVSLVVFIGARRRLKRR